MSNELLSQAESAYQSKELERSDALCRRRLRQSPIDAAALHLLGRIHVDRGDAIEGVRLITQSLSYAPNNADAWYDLGRHQHSRRLYNEASDSLKHAIQYRPDFFQAYKRLGRTYYALGRIKDAAELYAEWVRRDPTNAEAHHLLAATSGTNVPGRCSDEYVQDTFDGFSATFDQRLGALNYRGPEIVAAAMTKHVGSDETLTAVLDAGCGTGLCGPLIRSYCLKLVGVDLSEKMLERARERAVYDELAAGEICTYMESAPNRFDAIISADVLVYFGDLERLMRTAASALKVGGIFIATTEALTEDTSQPYKLEVHGRYSHRESYLREAIAKAGLEVVDMTLELIRMEGGREAMGHAVTARKPL